VSSTIVSLNFKQRLDQIGPSIVACVRGLDIGGETLEERYSAENLGVGARRRCEVSGGRSGMLLLALSMPIEKHAPNECRNRQLFTPGWLALDKCNDASGLHSATKIQNQPWHLCRKGSLQGMVWMPQVDITALAWPASLPCVQLTVVDVHYTAANMSSA
jgi:hypothetical protein